ncbi:MAG TPA: hypothetical protein DCQ64_21920, partial [Candidatus Rokubacteria bacterium]|nr:hypothetical protein [Candidatus Rokubacteria bacterium]
MGLAELDTYLKPDEGAPTPSDEKALVLVAPTSGIRALDKFLSEPTAMTTAQKIVRSAAPSIVGGAVGGAVGTAISPGVGTVVGTSVGSAAGEAVQQFFDPLQSGEATGSVTQIGVAGALPFVPAGLRRFFVSLPGAAAGLQDFLFKRLGTKAETLVAKFAPVAGTADDLFREVRRAGAGVSVPLTETAAATTRIAKEVAESKFATGGAKALASRAEAFVKPGAVSFDDFRLNQSDLGAVIRSLEKQGGPALGRAKLLYKSMVQDLDAALAKTKGPTAEKLGQAIDAFKREQAADFFKDAFMKSSLRRVGRQNLDVDAFMTKIDRNRDVLER